jgi:carboxylesterase type B
MLESVIFLGAKNSSEGRPVYVWIYGGRFSAGSNRESLYDGEGLAQKGLVVVNFNYRTGVFGFLAHPLLSQESGKKRKDERKSTNLHIGRGSGNYGLMDQIAALQWVG